jgi:beta propeller repeat protein
MNLISNHWTRLVAIVVLLVIVASLVPVETRSSGYSTVLDLLVDGAQAKYGDLTIDYHTNNHKHIGVLGGSFVIGGSLYIDLDDYAGITAEGQDGYVTVWVNAEGGFGVPPITGFAGFRRVKMKTNEPDPRFAVDFHVLDMSLPLFSFTAVSVDEHGEYSYDDIQGFQGIGLSLQIISARFCIAKFEVEKSVLESVFSSPVDPGDYTNLDFLPDLVSGLLDYYDTGGISVKQPFRKFTTSDAGDAPTVMAHINYLVGGIDVDSDGRRDNVYPVTTDPAPATGKISMTMATTGTQTADYRIQLVEDSVPAGWHIEAKLLSGEHGQTAMHLNNIPPDTWTTVWWYASCLSSASSIAEISFEIYQRKLLADVLLDTVHVTFYKQESVSPLVSIIEPSGGQGVTGEISVAARGTDNVGICKMTFSSDGDEFGSINVHPAISPAESSITWNTFSYEGDVTLEVTVQDPSGNVVSDSITVNVDHSGPNVPPSFEFVRPSGGVTSLVQGDWYTVRWLASDPDSDATIRLYYDTDQDYSSVVGLLRDPGGLPAVLSEDSPGDSFIWDTSYVAEGMYYVVAEVDDDVNPPLIVYSDGTVQIEPINPGDHFELTDMSQWQWDDDFSVNDQDYVNGIPEGLETLELKIPLRNKSGTDCQFVHTTLSSTASPIDFSEGDEYENYGSIDAGETVVPDGHFEFRVTSPSYTNAPFRLDLRYEDTSGNTYDQTLSFHYTFPVQGSTDCILNAGTPIFSDSGGDGVWESGERIDFYVPISNTGTAACVNPRGILEQSTAWGSDVFSDLSNVYPDIPVGESRSSTNDYDTYYAPRCFAGDIPATMHVEYGPDRDKVQDVTFTLTVTPAAYMEIRDSRYFGIASPGDIVEVPLTIYSDGSAPLEITSIMTDNPDSTVSGAPPTPFTIDPCSDQVVTINIDTTDAIGAITRVVTVTSSNAYFENTQAFTITGMVGDCGGEIMLVGGDGGQYYPHVYGNTLVYGDDSSGYRHIYMKDLSTGTITQLTTDTDYRYAWPRKYENFVVWSQRPETGDRYDWEIYLFDLDGVMTPNPKRLTNDDLCDRDLRIWGDYIMWEKEVTSEPSLKNDIFLYRISTESTENLTETPDVGEWVGEIQGNYAVWRNSWDIFRRTLSSGSTEMIPLPPDVDVEYSVSTYENRIVFTGYVSVEGDDDYIDVFLYDGSLTNISNDQNDIEEDEVTIWADNVVYSDDYDDRLYRIEIGVSGPRLFSCNTSHKDAPFIHGDTAVWEDDRNGNADIYMKSLIRENLAVVPGNISFEPPHPLEGETVTITALVNNLGESAQNDVVVRFYEGDPDTGSSQIGSDQTIPTIPAGGIEPAAVDWLATAEGPILTCVVVDPDNAIPENNELGDNKACKEMTVTDNDTDGPTIDDVGADEYSGDGDGLIEDDEQVRIHWTASDPSGIGDSSCTVDGTTYPATGSYEVIVGPFPEVIRNSATYNFTIEAQDGDNSPESTQVVGSFTVYPHTPAVIEESVFPPDGATDVVLRPVVEAGFCEPMDQSTLNSTTVAMQNSSLVSVPGDISYYVVTNTVTFVPSSDLSNSEEYTMTLLGGEGGIRAENGNYLESSFQWSFTTKPDTTIPECIISSPVVGQNISGMVEIRGTAWDYNFDSYQVFYGNGSSPSSWTNITAPICTPVLSNTLCHWDTTGLPDGEYSIQLRVHDQPPAYNENVCAIVVNKLTIEPLWVVEMAADAGAEGSNADLAFGIHLDATDGFDPGIDSLSPPTPPGALFEAYFSITDPLFTRLNKDFRGGIPNEWTLKVRSTEQDIELAWDNTEIPSELSVVMDTGIEQINMKAHDNVVLNAGQYTMTISVSDEVAIQLSLQAGWNMVSVPLALSNNAPGAVFPGVAGIFTWNATSRSYYVPTVIDPEKGYWVAVTENTTISVNGTPIETWTNDIKAGWNMIGSVITVVSIADPNDDPDGSVLPTAYWWDPVSKSYITTTDIEPGKGYWVPSIHDCVLTL